MKRVIAFWLLACVGLCAQQFPQATALPGQPFFIKQTWQIGGEGNWDQMVLDAAAKRLFIAHGRVVQVADVSTGALEGEVQGIGNAHGIALDASGQTGYVTDGPANQVRVFDRATFKVVASIPTSPGPRAIVLEPQSGLLFAVSATPLEPARAAQDKSHPPPPSAIRSAITVIDAQSRQPLGILLLPGKLGFAVADNRGRIYVDIVDQNRIARLDAQQALAAIHDAQAASGQAGTTPSLDWSTQPRPAGGGVRFFRLAPECHDPAGLAVDSAHDRLFAACGNMTMLVLNSETGEHVVSLPIGPGAEAIGYDPDRSLIVTANGGAQGTLTLIRQDVADTYAVIQNLPTRQRARTLAINPGTSEIYLVTENIGVKIDPKGGIGSLLSAPVQGTFQVLVIGN
jgi:YVTN family beta-propeller protein